MATYIILGVLLLMIIAMVLDKFEFGVAPMLAVIILAITGVVTMQEAFAGFTNKYVLVTAAFLVISTAFGRTNLITKIQQAVMNLQKGKSGIVLFLVLILFVLVIAVFMQPGPAVLLLMILLNTLPENETPSKSQMFLPLGTLCNIGQAKLPIGMALIIVMWVNGFLESAGSTLEVSLTKFLLAGIFPLVVGIVYSLFAYKLLPKHSIDASPEEKAKSQSIPAFTKFQEIMVYIVFAASTLGMFVSNDLGDYVYLIPIAGVALMVATNVISFKEVRGTVNHQLIFLLAGIFALADIMANKGISAMLGNWIQGALGGSTNGWLIMFIFGFATVILANLTGSNIGTMMIISPIAVSTALAAGVDPRATVVAVVASASASVIMPMDTVMGIVFANGKYKLGETFKYTIPLTIVYITAICISAGLIFPM